MAESRMSSYWVEWKTQARTQTRLLIAVCAPLLPLWTSSLLRRHITWSTYWTNELSPLSITSQPQYHRPRARLLPGLHLPAPATQVLHPPWIQHPFPLQPRVIIFRKYSFLLAVPVICNYHCTKNEENIFIWFHIRKCFYIQSIRRWLLPIGT